MGHRLNMDGKCIVCGEYTDFFCDSCLNFICKSHQIIKETGSFENVNILCPKCYKLKRKVIHPIEGQMHKEQGC